MKNLLVLLRTTSYLYYYIMYLLKILNIKMEKPFKARLKNKFKKKKDFTKDLMNDRI